MRYCLLLTIAWLFVSCASLQPEITVPELEKHVYTLSSDEMGGRKPGEKGGDAAARYIRDELRKAGCVMDGHMGLQSFRVTTNVKMGKRNSLEVGGVVYELNKHFVPFAFSGSTKVEAPVIFAGYGLVVINDTLDWDDYRNLDVKGKWVLVFRGVPFMGAPDNPFNEFSQPRSKVIAARDKGAAGVLFVSPVAVDSRDELVPPFYDKNESDAGIPVLHIKREVANSLFSKVESSVEDMEQRIEQLIKPQGRELSSVLKGETQVYPSRVKTANVVGHIKGNDPLLRNEYIVIGAHYDHLGMGGPGSGSRMPDTLAIHNGADDNASGVAAVIELAQFLMGRKKELKRSVMFVAFSAEEMGLLGSRYFTSNLPISKSSIVAMINLDMVGRLKTVDGTLLVGGTGTAKESEGILTQLGKDRSFRMNFSPEGYGASDHASFYAKDIPVFFFTTSAHEDYHTPFDDADRLNYLGQKEVVDLVSELSLKLLDEDKALTFQEAGPRRRVSMGQRFRVTLGIMPDFAGVEKRGLRIDLVRKDGPADIGGLEKGDIITAIDGKPVKDVYEYMFRLKNLEPGQTISVDVIRNEQKVVLLIQL